MKRVTDVFAVLIAVAGFGISYATQAVLASEHGFVGWEAWLWPGIADSAALAMILRLHFGQVRQGWYTVEAWLVFALAATIMVAANAIAARNDPLGGAMHAVVPVVAMLVWHVIIHGRPAEADEATVQPVTKTATKVTSRRAQERPSSEPFVHPRRRPRTTRSAARKRLTRLVRERPQIGPTEAARRLRISRTTARRWLEEARRPRVVVEAER